MKDHRSPKTPAPSRLMIGALSLCLSLVFFQGASCDSFDNGVAELPPQMIAVVAASRVPLVAEAPTVNTSRPSIAQIPARGSSPAGELKDERIEPGLQIAGSTSVINFAAPEPVPSAGAIVLTGDNPSLIAGSRSKERDDRVRDTIEASTSGSKGISSLFGSGLVLSLKMAL